MKRKTAESFFYAKINAKDALKEENGAYLFEGIATTSNPDREYDILEHLGAFFDETVPLLMHHDAKQPVGIAYLYREDDAIRYVAVIERPEDGDDTDFAKRRRSAIAELKAGVIRGVSIGFLPVPGSVKKLPSGGKRISRYELIELSLVSVPANRDASITEIKSVVRATKALEKKEIVSLDYAKLIASRKSAIEVKQARIAEIAGGVGEDGSFSEEEGAELDALTVEVENQQKDVARFEKLLNAGVKTATPVDKTPGTKQPRVPAAGKKTITREAGTGFARYAMVLAAGKGNLMQSQQIAQSRFADDDELNVCIKAAVEAGTTTGETWAKPLVDEYKRFAGDFVEFLRPLTILGRFGQNGIPDLRRVPFNISIPSQISGGEGYWVGEGKAKPLTKFDFGNVTLRWNKVANIAVLTDELIRFSEPSAERLVRDALASALVSRLDIDFINPAKAEVTDVSPASITNGVTPIVSGGSDLENVRADVRAVFGQFISNSIAPTSGVWIMSQMRALALSQMREPLGQKAFPEISMLGGTFEGLPVIVSQYVADDVVILVNASDIYLADDGGVAIDSSREASLQMDNAPTMNSDTPTAIETVSMFQTNSVALRAERYITWKRRRAQAVAVVTGVTWGAVT